MRIVLFRGRPGVGKTTLSTAIAEACGHPVLRKDDIYHMSAKRLDEHASRNDLSYETIYTILETNQHVPCTFLLDCPFQHPGDMEALHAWCTEHQVELKSILVVCSNESLWAERISNRGERPHNIHHFTSFEKLKNYYGTMHLSPEAGELVIDTVQPIESSLEKIRAYIA
jgi:adenylate kinase family enzyme